MTMEEGKGKKRKRQAGDEAGNRPSSEGESSEQLEEGKEERMQTGTANEADNRRRGRPPLPPPSEEERERRRMKKIEGDRVRRKKNKKLQEMVKKFCEEQGTTEEFKAFCEKHEKSLKVMEEEERRCSEETYKLFQVWEDDEANQVSDKEIQMLLTGLTKNLEMNQTGVLEGVTAIDSSSFGAMGTPFERARELKRKRDEELDGAHRGKRPLTAYTTRRRPPIGGLMAETCQNNLQSAAALATKIQTREATHDKEASSSQPPPRVVLRKFTDDKLGLGSKKEVSVYNLVNQYGKLKDAERRKQEAVAASIDAKSKSKEFKKEADNLNKQVKVLKEGVSKLKAELAEKGKISKDALELRMIDAVTLGWNLMKELLQSKPAGSEFLGLPLLDTIQRSPSLQNKFNEGLILIGQGHPIDDKVAIQSDDPPVVVPHSLYLDAWLANIICEPNDFAHLGDAANSPQFQAANARPNNVEQEDDANDQEDG